MTRKRTERPAAEVAAQEAEDETQARHELADPGIPEYLPDSAPSADMTATAEAMRAAAAEGRDFAARNRAEAQELMEAARAEVARIMTAAEAEARELGTEADRREREAHNLAARSEWLHGAAGIQDQAAADDATAADLETEREQLGVQLAETGGNLARVLAEREDVAGQLARAELEADTKRATAARASLSGIDGTLARLNGRHDAITARLAAIGDADGGLLGEALRAAQSHHSHVRRILSDVWPDRPEAQADQARAALRDTAMAVAASFAART
jgi:chromosome segregation ATPase